MLTSTFFIISETCARRKLKKYTWPESPSLKKWVTPAWNRALNGGSANSNCPWPQITRVKGRVRWGTECCWADYVRQQNFCKYRNRNSPFILASRLPIKLIGLTYGQRVLKTKGDFIIGRVRLPPRDELAASIAWSYRELEARKDKWQMSALSMRAKAEAFTSSQPISRDGRTCGH